jgi:hypothetical protein
MSEHSATMTTLRAILRRERFARSRSRSFKEKIMEEDTKVETQKKRKDAV